MRYVIHETYQYIEEYEVDAADKDEALLLHNADRSEHVRQSAAPERVRLSINRSDAELAEFMRRVTR